MPPRNYTLATAADAGARSNTTPSHHYTRAHCFGSSRSEIVQPRVRTVPSGRRLSRDLAPEECGKVGATTISTLPISIEPTT